ncbi:hypothetical protein INR49_028760, partial [Caranx melampygus]
GTTAAPPGTTAAPSGTTAAPSGTTAAPSGTTAAPSGTTAAPSGTTAAPSGTTAAPSGTTAAPSGTTAAPSGTTAAPSGTTAAPSGTTAAPSGTTAAPSGTTAAPSGTTAAPSGTTTSPLGEEPFRPGPCQECYCSPKTDPVTKLNIITCKPVVCDTNCNKGYEYQAAHDKCCGTCVQKSCIFTTPDNTTQVIEVNDTYVPTNDKCVTYTCEKINGQLVTKETKISCPPFNPLDCEPGTETTDANGCCKSCKIRSVCDVQYKTEVIEVNDCKSAEPVNMTSCAGHCGSSSIYSAAANKMMQECQCCRETSTSQKQVELICGNGSKVQHTYMVADGCSCSTSECVPGTSKPQRRRRR